MNETEQLLREVQLADVLELAAAKVRSGEGWREGTTADVLREIWHVFPEHAKQALALALLTGRASVEEPKSTDLLEAGIWSVFDLRTCCGRIAHNFIMPR